MWRRLISGATRWAKDYAAMKIPVLQKDVFGREVNIAGFNGGLGEGIIINGCRIAAGVYAHLGRGNARAEGVLRDVVSANVFDMVDSKEGIEGVISGMRYWETVEEYNAANGEDLTEEEILDKDGFCPLCCYDGFVTYCA